MAVDPSARAYGRPRRSLDPVHEPGAACPSRVSLAVDRQHRAGSDRSHVQAIRAGGRRHPHRVFGHHRCGRRLRRTAGRLPQTRASGGGGLVRITTGSEVRDWAVQTDRTGFFPRRDDHNAEDIRSYPRLHDRLWPYRTTLRERRAFGALHRASGRPWYDWTQMAARAGGDRPVITFSWVASHNHFALQRGRVIALQSAPVIELPEDSNITVDLTL